MVSKSFQLSSTYLQGILNTKCTRSSITWVSQRRHALFCQLLIKLLEIVFIDQYFAAYFNSLQPVIRKTGIKRNGSDLFDIGSNIITSNTITTGRSSHQAVIF